MAGDQAATDHVVAHEVANLLASVAMAAAVIEKRDERLDERARVELVATMLVRTGRAESMCDHLDAVEAHRLRNDLAVLQTGVGLLVQRWDRLGPVDRQTTAVAVREAATRGCERLVERVRAGAATALP